MGCADGVGGDAGVGAAVGRDHVADVDVAYDVVVHGHVLPDKVPAVTKERVRNPGSRVGPRRSETFQNALLSSPRPDLQRWNKADIIQSSV